ncbi:MAG: glutamyl-tRNA reductase [Dermatophilaceae bacterium]
MSVLVLGLSHHSAPLALLEQVSLDADGAHRLAHRVAAAEAVEGAVVLSTCNRLEVYAGALTFHGALASMGEALAGESGVALELLHEHLYVHYEDRAVAHACSVAAGLDSMAVGESQILGQLREAYRLSQRAGLVPEELGSVLRHALHVGKRAHAETGIDRVSHSLVQSGLQAATAWVGPIGQAQVLVIGAGGMSGVAAAAVAAAHPRRLVIVNRTSDRAQRLAAATGGVVVPMTELDAALAQADVVISCTGAVGHLVSSEQVTRARAGSAGTHRQAFLDLAMPHDIDPGIGALDGVHLIDLAQLGERLADEAGGRAVPEVQEVTDLVTAQVAEYLTQRLAKRVTPTVAALRARAAVVVDAELSRLDQKAPELDDAVRDEVHRAVHRIVDKLLHTPTVRIKQLSVDGHPGDYETALRELFDLDPNDVAAVCVPPEPSAVDPNLWRLP